MVKSRQKIMEIQIMLTTALRRLGVLHRKSWTALSRTGTKSQKSSKILQTRILSEALPCGQLLLAICEVHCYLQFWVLSQGNICGGLPSKDLQPDSSRTLYFGCPVPGLEPTWVRHFCYCGQCFHSCNPRGHNTAQIKLH